MPKDKAIPLPEPVELPPPAVEPIAPESGEQTEEPAKSSAPIITKPELANPACGFCKQTAKFDVANMTFTNGILALLFYCHWCRATISVVPFAQQDPRLVGIGGNPTRSH